MDISKIKTIIERRIDSVISALEDPEKCDDSGYLYYRGIIEELKSLYTELFGEDEFKLMNHKNFGPKVFFKIFKDDYGNDRSCVEKLNKFILDNPNLKIVSCQMVQYTESRYGSAVLNRWEPKNTYLSYQILVQFERVED